MIEGVVADEQGVLAEGAIGVSGRRRDPRREVRRHRRREAAYELVVAAEQAGNLDIEGVLVANADAEGKINIVKMTDHHTRKGFAIGAVAGVVVGIIFPPSIIASALVVGAGGAAIGKLGNLNARNATARDLASVLTPGSSGIIAVVKLAQVDAVKEKLPDAEEVKAAPVSDEAAAAVKDAAKAGGSVPVA